MNKDIYKPPSTELNDQNPDREEIAGNNRKNSSSIRIKYIAIAVLTPLLLCLGPVLWVHSQISNQQTRNEFLEEEIAAAEERIQEVADHPKLLSQYLAKLNVYSALRSNGRRGVVQLLGELSRRLPDGISLRSMQLQGDKLTLAGIALSGEAVERLGGRLAESGLMASSVPHITVTETEEGRVEFTFRQRVDFEGENRGEGR
jgi:Tfp pilus assembly protein PilN